MVVGMPRFCYLSSGVVRLCKFTQHRMAHILSGVKMLSYIGLCRSCKLGLGQKFEDLALVNSDGMPWSGFVRAFVGSDILRVLLL